MELQDVGYQGSCPESVFAVYSCGAWHQWGAMSVNDNVNYPDTPGISEPTPNSD